MGVAEIGVTALLIFHRQRMNRSDQPRAIKRQLVWCIIQQSMSPRLRFEQQCEGRITGNTYAFDGIHLNGYDQRHI